MTNFPSENRRFVLVDQPYNKAYFKTKTILVQKLRKEKTVDISNSVSSEARILGRHETTFISDVQTWE